MTIRKTTIGNSVRYIPKAKKTRESKPNIKKLSHFFVNKTKIFRKILLKTLLKILPQKDMPYLNE